MAKSCYKMGKKSLYIDMKAKSTPQVSENGYNIDMKAKNSQYQTIKKHIFGYFETGKINISKENDEMKDLINLCLAAGIGIYKKTRECPWCLCEDVKDMIWEVVNG